MPFVEIGRGSQFKVYDMRDGRVLKIPLTEQECYYAAKHRLALPYTSLADIAEMDVRVQTLMNGKARIPEMITHPFDNQHDFLKLIGNPTVIESSKLLPEDTPVKRWGPARVIYTQDYVEMTGPILTKLSGVSQLKKTDRQQVIRVIEEYIQIIYKLWEFGYSDYVFKIGDTGFDANGNFVAIDLGEMSSDFSFIEKALGEQRWRGATKPEKIDFPQIPRELCEEYITMMERALTPLELKKRWRTKHVCSQCAERDGLKDFITAKVSEIDFIDRW